MIYLVRSGEYVKLGHTNNWPKRWGTLLVNNPNPELLSKREGTNIDEFNLKILLEKYHFNREWYYYDKDLVKIFNDYIPTEKMNDTRNKDHYKKGSTRSRMFVQYDHNWEIIKIYYGQFHAAKCLGLKSHTSFYRAVKNKTYYKHYHWGYINVSDISDEDKNKIVQADNGAKYIKI